MMNTSEIQGIKDMVGLIAKVESLEVAHIANVKRIETLEEYKARTERYGFFLMGIMAVGVFIAAGFEKAINFILKGAP